jgi:glycosyltransferase involved in cell wall biosynthesis
VRIAWLGPEPTFGGGVPYVATQILSRLPLAGATVDAYIAATGADLSRLEAVDGLQLVREMLHWQAGRWYSRDPFFAVTSSQLARLRAQRRLTRLLVDAHAHEPYDLVYQFSQFESPWSARTAKSLPPVLVHPEVHAAGELEWLRRESGLARRCEPAYMRLAVRGVLASRVHLQRRSAGAVAAIVAPSRAFARDVERDYAIEPDRVHVVPNPVDLERFAPALGPAPSRAPLTLLYVSRIAVRKGVELIVGLSHRLGDLADAVRIHVVGDRSMFSDYRPLLRDLNPALASYEGARSAQDLAALYKSADVLLQPSQYEPFALTVAEALASGVPVVASDRVGATEGVDRRACRVFASGNLDAFEAAVRGLLDDLAGNQQTVLRTVARSEAERLFAPDLVARQLVDVFAEVARQP